MSFGCGCITGAKIFAELFENYAEVNAFFTLSPPDGEEEILLPYLSEGVLCDLEISCDGVLFASANAVNLRELNAYPGKINRISVSRRFDGLILLKLSDLPAKKSVEVKVTICLALHRHANHSSLIFYGGGIPDASVMAEINIKINGKVAKALSPTHRITTAQSQESAEVTASGNIFSDSFILDIFYAENQPDGVIISRHPLVDNIALCRFTPRLEGVSKKPHAFDINILNTSDKVSTAVISALSIFLACLDESQIFRISVNGGGVADFLTATEENIGNAIDLVCGFGGPSSPFEESPDAEKVIFASGGACPESDFKKTPFVILSGGFANLFRWQKIGHCVCVSENDAQSILPYEFKKVFGAVLWPAYIEPIGGMGVTLLPEKTNALFRGAEAYCFAKHDVIPPQGVRILDKNKKTVEEIDFKTLSSCLRLRPVDIMYVLELVKKLESEARSAPPEKVCLIREKINRICLENKIALGDIALVSFCEDGPLGIISKSDADKHDYGKYFSEDISGVAPEIIQCILNSQTADGVIADISVSRPEGLIFSTAVCLIALYLYTGKDYFAFAKRSLDFLNGKDGFWAKAAIGLWLEEKIDIAELKERAEMKIMYERIDELAVLLIQNYRRKTK